MSAATCPNCLESVTVPPGAKPETLVRCPLCQEEFELSLVLDSMPPRLIVVGGSESADERAAGSSSIGSQRPAFLPGPVLTDDSAEGEFRLADDGEHAGAFQFEQRGESGAGVGATKVTTRPKKKGKNGAVEMVKIVAGGVIGLSIGYVLIWWISPLVGKRPTDPIGLAPTISRFVPWIVPQSLRAPAPANDSQEGSGFNSAAADAGIATATSGNGTSGNGKSGNGKSGVGNRPAAAGKRPAAGQRPRPSQLAPANNPPSAPGQSLGSPPFDSLSPSETPGVTIPEIAEPTVEPPAIEPDLSGLGPELAESLVADAPAIPIAMFEQRVAAAASTCSDWRQAEEADKARLAVNCYVALGALGEATTFVDRSQPKTGPHLAATQKLLRELAADPVQAEVFGKLGAKWIKSSSRTNRGVFLSGVVESSEDHGDLHELRLNLSGTTEPLLVSVFSKTAPDPPVAAGTALVVLGAIVTDPALNLTGYTGDEPLVVVAGSHAAMP